MDEVQLELPAQPAQWDCPVLMDIPQGIQCCVGSVAPTIDFGQNRAAGCVFFSLVLPNAGVAASGRRASGNAGVWLRLAPESA